MDAEDSSLYSNADAGSVPAMCPTCAGHGYLERPFTTAVPGVLDHIRAQRDACPDCRVGAVGSSGRMSLATGPGTRKLRAVDRVAIPGDFGNATSV